MKETNKETVVGFAMCGSFCTFSRALEQMKKIAEEGYRIIPIMSENAMKTDTRFGKASEIIKKAENICGTRVIGTIRDAEPIGPERLLDILVIEPCTGNTAAKLANGVTDTSVTLAAKAHLRNNRPVLLGIASNDAFSGSAGNIGKLLNTKNIYFIPFGQDSSKSKPRSAICDFEKTLPSIEAALEGRQLQPIISYIG